MDLLANYTQFREVKSFFPKFSIQLCSNRKRLIIQNYHRYAVFIGVALVAGRYVKRTKT